MCRMTRVLQDHQRDKPKQTEVCLMEPAPFFPPLQQVQHNCKQQNAWRTAGTFIEGTAVSGFCRDGRLFCLTRPLWSEKLLCFDLP